MAQNDLPFIDKKLAYDLYMSLDGKFGFTLNDFHPPKPLSSIPTVSQWKIYCKTTSWYFVFTREGDLHKFVYAPSKNKLAPCEGILDCRSGDLGQCLQKIFDEWVSIVREHVDLENVISKLNNDDMVTPAQNHTQMQKDENTSDEIFVIEPQKRNSKARIFIGSSVESIEIAKAIQLELDHEFEPTVWHQNVFKIGSFALEDLIEKFKEVDYAIFVFSPDDVTRIRKEDKSTIRDNVIFEFGLAIGLIGKGRVFAIQPRHSPLHIPTDLVGINNASYNNERSDNNIVAAVGAAVTQIKGQLKNFKTPPKNTIIEFSPIEAKYKKIHIMHPYGDSPIHVQLLTEDGNTPIWTPKQLNGMLSFENQGMFMQAPYNIEKKYKVIISQK